MAGCKADDLDLPTASASSDRTRHEPQQVDPDTAHESPMEATKLPFEEVNRAIIEGGKTRLRPVLLTAITTVLGLLPLAIGLNIDFVGLLTQYDPNIYVGGDNNVFWKPMSWAIIFGLTFATFLTLIIVPVMYWWIERTTYKWAGRSVEASA